MEKGVWSSQSDAEGRGSAHSLEALLHTWTGHVCLVVAYRYNCSDAQGCQGRTAAVASVLDPGRRCVAPFSVSALHSEPIFVRLCFGVLGSFSACVKFAPVLISLVLWGQW